MLFCCLGLQRRLWVIIICDHLLYDFDLAEYVRVDLIVSLILMLATQLPILLPLALRLYIDDLWSLLYWRPFLLRCIV